MFNRGKKYLAQENNIRAKLKNHAPFEEKNILQFNHGTRAETPGGVWGGDTPPQYRESSPRRANGSK